MARKKSILSKMEVNPRGDWSMSDIETLARQEGLEVRKPSRGSHYVVSSPKLRDALTVPYNRPIKPIYIRNLVSYAMAHRKQNEGEK